MIKLLPVLSAPFKEASKPISSIESQISTGVKILGLYDTVPNLFSRETFKKNFM